MHTPGPRQWLRDDRLTATTPLTAPPGGIGPIAAGGLSGTQLVYDSHGNTTQIADQTLGYDPADRHILTTLNDGTSIAYLWGPGGDIVQRTVTKGSTVEVTRFGSGLVLDGSGGFRQDTVSLPAGGDVDRVLGCGAWVVVVPEHPRGCGRDRGSGGGEDRDVPV